MGFIPSLSSTAISNSLLGNNPGNYFGNTSLNYDNVRYCSKFIESFFSFIYITS
jgi:hypothetical protein